MSNKTGAIHTDSLQYMTQSDHSDYIRLIESIGLLTSSGVTIDHWQQGVTIQAQCDCSTGTYTMAQLVNVLGCHHAQSCKSVKIQEHTKTTIKYQLHVFFKMLDHLYGICVKGEQDELKRSVCSLVVKYLVIYYREHEDYTLFIRNLRLRHIIPGHGLEALASAGLHSLAAKLASMDSNPPPWPSHVIPPSYLIKNP